MAAPTLPLRKEADTPVVLNGVGYTCLFKGMVIKWPEPIFKTFFPENPPIFL